MTDHMEMTSSELHGEQVHSNGGHVKAGRGRSKVSKGGVLTALSLLIGLILFHTTNILQINIAAQYFVLDNCYRSFTQTMYDFKLSQFVDPDNLPEFNITFPEPPPPAPAEASEPMPQLSLLSKAVAKLCCEI